ncbi:hypothetical protein MTR_2g103777 [Medicago truncatula]|uniref:Uncharacterized protein n=1 Tax=Medicago truncatula TaxID=3880 RepID=A0A072VC44_MEDTR|nr:hypothetical protein MTR_2g103777 [Medicago truncatula]
MNRRNLAFGKSQMRGEQRRDNEKTLVTRNTENSREAGKKLSLGHQVRRVKSEGKSGKTINSKTTPNSLVNLRLELSMNEQEFSSGFKGLHLFLDYKGKNFLSQSVYKFNFRFTITVNQFKGGQTIQALRTEIRKMIQ